MIIPFGTTLDCEDVELHFSNSSMKSNILILGNITNANQTYERFYPLHLSDGSINVILGPQSVFDYNQIDKYSIIYYSKDTMKCILYPGCEIKTNDIGGNLSQDTDYRTIRNNNGDLYLNRYVTEKDETNRNKLVGSMNRFPHIIYPTTIKDDNNTPTYIKEAYKLKAGTEDPYDNFSTTQYFQKLYWYGASHNYNASLGADATYHFELPVPIEFDATYNTLKLNGNSELAKYDVALWNECKVESGMYSFNEFVNKSDDQNKDKYIDTDTLEDLFMDGKTYRNPNSKYSFYGLLNNMPNSLKCSLKGSKKIITISSCTVEGDVSNYCEKFYIASGGNQSVSLSCGKVKSLNELANKISRRKFKYTFISDSSENLSTVIVKNEQFGDNVSRIWYYGNGATMKDKDAGEEFYNCFANDEEPELDYRDTINHINLYNEKGIKWDLSTIEKCFYDGSTYNPSKSDTPGLLNNIPINLLENEIKIDLIGDKQIKLFSDKDYDYVTLSGNNTAYTGTIIIPSNIGKICLKYGGSKANINDGSRKYTAIQDNALQVLNEYKNNVKIYYNCKQITENSSPINLNNILVLNDERDVIANINKYNVEVVTWDLSTIENCFKDGDGLLSKFPINTINANLVGSNDIIIDTDKTELVLLGNNTEYIGTMTVPSVITDIYLKETSKIQNISYNSITYSVGEEIPGLTFHYIDKKNNDGELVSKECKHIWDLAKNGNKLEENLTDEEFEDKTIILTDSGEIKTNVIKITGDNRNFKGIIITTPGVKEIIFGRNSFVRTVNVNGSPLKYTFIGNNNVTDYNDYSILNSKNGAKVNIISNNESEHLKNEKKNLNINVEKINVGKNGILQFAAGNKVIIGKK